MIHTYNSQNFLNLKKNLLDYFSLHHDELINTNSEFLLLFSIFKNIFDNKYIELLSKLDESELKYHNWPSFNDAINDNFLGYNNRVLYAFSDSHTIEGRHRPIEVAESLFLILYADIYEASLIYSDSDIRIDLQSLANDMQSFGNSLSSTSFQRLTYLWFIVPKEVFTKHLNKHLNTDVLRTIGNIKNNETYISEKLDESNELKASIALIQRSLDEQKSEYNFVGLSDGFRTLRKQKKSELKSQNVAYYGLMTIITLLIISKSIWSASYLSSNTLENPIFIIITISTVLFLFILLYFFKISLVNVKSIKSQILQIDLRLTLCQFIHNYDSDTKDLREGMKESFGKFESVIFAPLVATEDQMPATFDGLEQLTGLLSSFNKSSK